MKVFAFFCLFLFCFNLSARLVEKTQAQVGKEMISLIDLKNFQKLLKERLKPPSLLLKYAYNKTQLLKDRKKLLNFMVTRELLAQIAEKENLPEIPKENVEQELAKLKKTFRKSFSTKLKRTGLSVGDLKAVIFTDLKVNSLLNHFLIPKVIVSEEDVESYYFNKYKQSLFKSFEYEFVSLPIEENKKPAVLKALAEKKFDSLEQLAQSFNLPVKSFKLKGKDIQKTLKLELDKLSVSEISPLIIVGGVYYLLELKWKQPRINPEDQRKKTEIEQLIYKKKLSETMKKWIKEKRQSFL